MYIGRLEITGFKSFPDKIVLPFEPGISAVVGPNGCGKSNIIDAIRWVMGEQSPKTLRGRNMDDILFNGSANRSPSALAEVTLTLTRHPEALNQTGPAEVSVSRRLYRNGDSEYLINRIPSRLKDVTHLFMGAGVGTRAYGIIEQGRIGWLVDAKAEERRILIDEAAGVTKYKLQKKEAEKKIETSENNLLHVNTLMSENQKQLNSIARQAAKAAQYKSLKAELKELDLILSAKELKKLWTEKSNLENLRQENQDLLKILISQVDKYDLEAERLKLELLELEKKLELSLATWHELEGKRKTCLKEIEFNANTIKINEDRTNSLNNNILSLKSEKSKSLEEKLFLQEELIQLKNQASEAQNLRDQLRENWLSEKSLLEQHKTSFNSFNSKLKAINTQFNSLNEKIASADSLQNHHQSRLINLKNEKSRLEADIILISEQCNKIEQEKNDLDSNLQHLNLNLEEQAQLKSSLKNLVDELFIKQSSIEKELSKHLAKLDALTKLKESYAWYPEGVKELLNSTCGKNLLGPLAEHLNIPAGYEKAAETFLGDKLTWLVAENFNTAFEAIQWLKEQNAGRCGFLITKNKTNITKELLGNFEALKENQKVFQEPEDGKVFLSTEGDYFSADILIGGSASSKQNEQGLLERLKELEDSQNLVDDLEIDLQKVQKDYKNKQTELFEADKELTNLQTRINGISTQLNNLDKQLIISTTQKKSQLEAKKSLEVEEEKILLAIETITENKKSFEQDKLQQEKEIINLETEIKQINEILQQSEENLSFLKEDGQNAAHQASLAIEKSERAQNDLDKIEDFLDSVDIKLDEADLNLEKLQHELDSLKSTQQSLQEQMSTIPIKIFEAENILSGIRKELENHKNTLKEKEDQARQTRKRREELASILNQQETQLLEIRFSLEKIEERLLNDWDIIMSNPDVALNIEIQNEIENSDKNVSGDIENFNEEIKIPLQTNVNPLEYASKNPGADAEKRRYTLKNKISSLGEVNLEAINEETALTERHNFYTKQYEDINQALEDLKNSIEKINQTCENLFIQTFNSVNEKFKEIFPVLFEGGEGWLSLTDENNPLESGVEIHVSPPGKKIMLMSLLSGGEKALTALALIFALYLIKPSPFCLLDETDAPLDEANIDRFNRLLKQLSRTSQIIMITHNKRTMQISSTLYGVTMENPGVSKLVGVNLKQAQALVDI